MRIVESMIHYVIGGIIAAVAGWTAIPAEPLRGAMVGLLAYVAGYFLIEAVLLRREPAPGTDIDRSPDSRPITKEQT